MGERERERVLCVVESFGGRRSVMILGVLYFIRMCGLISSFKDGDIDIGKPRHLWGAT